MLRTFRVQAMAGSITPFMGDAYEMSDHVIALVLMVSIAAAAW
jgi:hypothetical protein